VTPPVCHSVRGVSVLVAPGRPVFLSLWLGFSTSPLSISFFLVLPDPLHVSVPPEANFNASLLHSPRFLYLPVQQPANEGRLADSNLFGDLRCRVRFHLQ
jgi:hypothetical protein